MTTEEPMLPAAGIEVAGLVKTHGEGETEVRLGRAPMRPAELPEPHLGRGRSPMESFSATHVATGIEIM